MLLINFNLKKNLFIYGSGAQGRVALDILKRQYPHSTILFIDDNIDSHGKIINGTRVIGSIMEAFKISKKPSVHIAIGNPFLREQIIVQLLRHPVNFLSVIDPSAVIMGSCTIGEGAMVGANSIINTDSNIGNFCIINSGAIVEHDCIFADYVCISPGACIGGRVNIGKYSFISSRATIVARSIIGVNSIVGMGSIVTKKVADNVLVFGAPAVVREKIDQNFNWNRIL